MRIGEFTYRDIQEAMEAFRKSLMKKSKDKVVPLSIAGKYNIYDAIYGEWFKAGGRKFV